MGAKLRILLKLSGEALMGERSHGIDIRSVEQLLQEIRAVCAAGTGVSIVIGGGNIIRGGSLAATGMSRVVADQMGMLATLVNALALQEALERQGLDTRVMSAIEINQVCESYICRRAVRHLEKGRVVIFAAGTGNPFLTTDTAASLRAIEINADLLLKATKVDGVYDDDPEKNPHAKRLKQLDYNRVLQDNLGVMDTTAIVMCRDNGMPIRVFNMYEAGVLGRIVDGEDIGTLISGDTTGEGG